jgi:TonB family protein
MGKICIVVRLAFCLLLLSSWLTGGLQSGVEVRAPWKALKRIDPPYPEYLKKQGIEGKVLLTVRVDRKGRVVFTSVMKNLHPELDELAQEAVRQWIFEPFVHEGEPIPVTGFVSLVFFNEEPSEVVPESGPELPLSDTLRKILDSGAEYSEKLAASGLFYVCNEKINETKWDCVVKESWLIMGDRMNMKDNEVVIAKHKYPALEGKHRSAQLYDYQIINIEGKAEERRISIGENQKAARHREIGPPYSIKPVFVPAWLLNRERHDTYAYTMQKEENIFGKKAVVVEIRPRSGVKGDIKRGKIWLEKSSLRILKAEIETSFMPGFEETNHECSEYHFRARFTTTHLYSFEKNGILFPTRSDVRIEYTGGSLQNQNALKLKASITYGSYRFFTGGTESAFQGIKKINPERVRSPKTMP